MTGRPTVLERFWSKVDRRGPDECWPWTAGQDNYGYGTFFYRGRMVVASRAAWMVAHGDNITTPEFVCHTCDNRLCCNPAHLWLGSAADNARDMIAKGRARGGPETHKAPRRANATRVVGGTHCPRGHEYTPENTSMRFHKGSWERRCKECNRIGNRERSKQLRAAAKEARHAQVSR